MNALRNVCYDCLEEMKQHNIPYKNIASTNVTLISNMGKAINIGRLQVKYHLS